MKTPHSARPGDAAAAGTADMKDASAQMRAGSALGLAAPDITASEVALRELRRLLGAWLLYEPAARLGRDPEALHQLRVTVRRIDATLALFRHQLPAPLAQARRAAKVILRALGAARDLDVQLTELARYLSTLPEHERTAVEPLRAHLEAERLRARARMVRTLDAESTRRWLETLSSASTHSATGSAAADRALIVMPERVQRRYRKLRKSIRRLHATSAMEDFHLVRRRAKQLRYAIEAGGLMFGKAAADELKALRRLQDELGAHQDAYMARKRLADLAADPASGLPPATLFLMGRLAEHHAATTARTRKTLTRSWRRVRGRRWRTLREKLRQLSDSARATRPEPTAPLPPEPAVPAPAVFEHAPAAEPHSLKH
jgi:CHAD domain-containing protein